MGDEKFCGGDRIMIPQSHDRNLRTIRDSSNVCVLLVANKLSVASLDYSELGKFALVGLLRVSYNRPVRAGL